jgi:hypothetical protein
LSTSRPGRFASGKEPLYALNTRLDVMEKKYLKGDKGKEILRRNRKEVYSVKFH